MAKKYLEKNVYEATQERLEYIFNNFKKICIAFSGGKDSGVLMNITLDYAKKTNQLNKLCVYHLDYEAQYQMTTDYVENTFKTLPKEVEKYWLCLPIKAQCSTSMFQDYWTPWELSKKKLWVRDIPEYDYIINENNCGFEFNDWDYNVQENFSNWLGNDYCVLVGIRTQESLQRQSAITSQRKVNQFNNKNYITKKKNHHVAYPIYDWLTDDVWIANAKFGFEYNKLYDLFYQAGLSIDQMRVASPFNDYAQDSLKLYRIIDPSNWGKMVSRVNGVNFTGLYGGTTAMGWRNIKKPKHFTWKEYMDFLLDTLPEKTKENYIKKLKVSQKFWKEKGGVLDKSVIKKLAKNNVDFKKKGKTNYKTEKEAVSMEYLDDIDINEFKQIPTYKRMCVCIMKNDTTCKYMGFSQTKEEVNKRKEVIKKWENI